MVVVLPGRQITCMFDGPLQQGTRTDAFVLLPELEQIAPFEQLDLFYFMVATVMT